MNPIYATAASSAESIPQDVAFSPGRQTDDRIPKKNHLPDPIGSEGIRLPPGVVLPDSVTMEVLAGKPVRMLLEVSSIPICRNLSNLNPSF
jgi:hypothetical protein